MGHCFVMQPFDKGPFDKRYEDVIAPAIKEAGLEPYRVDRDPSVSIPIADIESGIRNADVCLADITTDNPNVWFELGYAIACNQLVVLICYDPRKTPFPFDVQHRSITKYKTESKRDFEQLKQDIIARIKAAVERREKIGHLSAQSSIANIEGLTQYELTALVTVAESIESPHDRILAYRVAEAMTNVGFTKIAVNLAISGLLEKDFLKIEDYADEEDRSYTVYAPTEKGMSWLMKNSDKLIIKRENNQAKDPYLSELDNELKMSTPSPPYYYKESGSDTYHWERSCSTNHYPDLGWKKSDTRPSGREQCNECKSK